MLSGHLGNFPGPSLPVFLLQSLHTYLMAVHQDLGRIITDYWLVNALDQKEREANSMYSPSPGDSWLLTFHFRCLFSCLSPGPQCPPGHKLRAQLSAQSEPAGLGPGAWKKIHVVFKQAKKKKTTIIAFIEHLLVPGTLHTSVLIISTTTWEVGIIITIL